MRIGKGFYCLCGQLFDDCEMFSFTLVMKKTTPKKCLASQKNKKKAIYLGNKFFLNPQKKIPKSSYRL